MISPTLLRSKIDHPQRRISSALFVYLTFSISLVCLSGCDSEPTAPISQDMMGPGAGSEVDLGGGEITGGETIAGGSPGGETLAGESPAGETPAEPLPSLVSCTGAAQVEMSAASDAVSLTLAQTFGSQRAEGALRLSWVDNPLERVIWDGRVVTPQDPQPDTRPQLELSCVEPEQLVSVSAADELEGALAGRRLVTPPLLVAPRVDRFTSEERWRWRRPARLNFDAMLGFMTSDGSELSLPELELWWWPLRAELDESMSSDELPLDSLGAPVRVMLRDPQGRALGSAEADAQVSFEIDEWGVYALATRTTPPPPRALTYQAVYGISMGGGGAAQMGVRHPERFDYVGAMGGPTDWLYMMHYVTDRLLGGFCQGDALGDFCGTGPVREPLEYYADFLTFPFSDNGALFNRDTYMKIFQDVVFALGNPTVYSPESPYLPPQIPASELLRSRRDRCATECRGDDCSPPESWLKLPMFYDDQFNPTGAFPVIPFCDGDLAEEDLGGWAEGEHDLPVEIFLAVDLNDNGRRDEGEPVIRNLSEPFEDVGCDGVASVDEPGYDPLYNPDPSGDDFHWLYNPFGTEGDKLFEGAEGEVGLADVERLPEVVRASDRAGLDTLRELLGQVACASSEPGEPFLDHGLDGVALTPQWDEGGFDWGEGDGVFNYNPNKISYIANTQSLWLARALSLEGGGPRFWIDGGIRDVLNFVIAGMHLAGRLNAVSPRSVVLYEGFDQLLGREPFLPNASDEARFDRLGDHVLLRYGDLDATPEAIEMGDGGHVGSDVNALSRLVGSLHWAMRGWKRALGDERAGLSPSRVIPESVESEKFGGRYRFDVITPPGYDDAENAERSYPVVYILHGYGQRVGYLNTSNVVFNGLMLSGTWPATIFVYPDGACSDMIVHACNDGVDNDGDGSIDLEDSACRNERGRTEDEDAESSPRRCADGVDNDLDGAIDLDDPGCVTASGDDEGECREGTFYLNHAVSIDGVSVGRDYEGAFLDMMDYIRGQYRVK